MPFGVLQPFGYNFTDQVKGNDVRRDCGIIGPGTYIANRPQTSAFGFRNERKDTSGATTTTQSPLVRLKCRIRGKAPKRRGTKCKHRLGAIIAVKSDTRQWNAEREEQKRGTRRDQAIVAADLRFQMWQCWTYCIGVHEETCNSEYKQQYSLVSGFHFSLILVPNAR